MTFRDVALATFARDARPATLRGSWARLRAPEHATRRLLATEDCSADLLSRLAALGIIDAVPADLLAAIRRRAISDGARMLAIRAQLPAVLSELDRRGVEVTLLKGAAFLTLGMRPGRACKDIDLLVAPAAASAAAVALRLLGFRPLDGAEWPGAHHLPPFRHPDGVVVELHTRALARGAEGTSETWVRREVAPGRWVLAPTDWCWHMLAHDAFHHVASGCVRSALDVAELLDRYGTEIDWDDIAARAAGWPDPIHPTLRGIEGLGWAVPIPLSRRTRLAIRAADVGREYAARVAARDDLFIYAAGKIGGLTLGSYATWTDIRRGPLHRPGARVIPSMARDAVRLAGVMLGRDLAVD